MATKETKMPNTNVETWMVMPDGTPHTTSQDYPVTQEFRTQTVTKNPGRFTQYLTQGYMPDAPYSMAFATRFLSSGNMRDKQNTSPVYGRYDVTSDQYVVVDGNDGPAIGIGDPAFGGLVNLAVAAMNQEVRNQQVSVFETVFEGRKTFDMICDTAETIAKAMRDVKRGNFMGAASQLGIGVPKEVSRHKKATDNWLAYRYGYTPLLGTITGALQGTYDAMKNYPGLILHARGSARKSFSKAVPFTRSYGYGTTKPYTGSVSFYSRRSFFVDSDESGSFAAQVGCTYRVTNPTLMASTSFGLVNVPLAAWELLPLSFVADWFVNVSDVLAQLDAWTGRQYLSGYTTKVLRNARTARSRMGAMQSGYINEGFTPASSTVRIVVMERTVNPNPPFVYPQIYAAINGKRLVDAISLLRQLAS
jgi:hypothetical protein